MIEILSGPPWNKSFEEIGWMNRRQVALLFRHRNVAGKLDTDGLRGDIQTRGKTDPDESFRNMRRMQGWSEELIEREQREMRAK